MKEDKSVLIDKISIEFYLSKEISVYDILDALNKKFKSIDFKRSNSEYRCEQGTKKIYFEYEYPNHRRIEEDFIHYICWFDYSVKPFLYRKFGQKIKLASKY
ncbi:MAG: hypothetical protein KGV59_06340 [Tenacibaculum sp.]|nr:hypothetical protein [Tenacibaculum sp.]